MRAGTGAGNMTEKETAGQGTAGQGTRKPGIGGQGLSPDEAFLMARIIMAQEIGAGLRKARESVRVRQGELAKALGVVPSIISDYENGRHKSPGIGFLARYVRALGRLTALRQSTK